MRRLQTTGAIGALLIIALSTTHAAAQQPPLDRGYPTLDPQRQGAENMELAGIVLTVAGLAGTGVGGIWMGVTNTSGDFGGFNLLPGMALTIATAPLIVIGIPLWVVGARRKASLGPPPPSIRVNATGAGLRLEGTF
jgi:hypothetical protein